MKTTVGMDHTGGDRYVAAFDGASGVYVNSLSATRTSTTGSTEKLVYEHDTTPYLDGV